MRCTGCGNELPDWANGVCYVCGRIRREEKRFGAHPGVRKQARSAPTPAPGSAASSGSGSGITLPSWLDSAEFGHCPICGQDVPQDRLEEHIELHTRMRRTNVSHRPDPKQPARTHARPAQRQVPKTAPPDERATDQTPLQVRRRAINQLLADIYVRKHFLSDILRQGGISQADITKIYEDRLAGFLEELLALWRIAFAGELVADAWHIITRHYGLDGVTPLPLKPLAQELAISPQRVREILAQTVRTLRTPASRACLESMTLTVANQQLGRT